MTVLHDFPRPDPALVEAFRTQSPATLHEALGRKGAMAHPIKPLYPGMRLCGPALTVSCGPTDNLMIHIAVALAKPGDVLVVDFKGMTEAGPWGDVLTAAAKARGIAGLVIDGCVRDATTIRGMDFPVFCRGTSMKGTNKTDAGGTVNTGIACGGVLVSAGDLVVADDDGVVVVPQAQAADTLAKAAAREAAEEGYREKLGEGETTLTILKLHPYLDAAGITV
ncbi:4-hydroxy-4-methyl-2-oxoglutarate aldolase [Azospirillum agricola]|uniref:4-carboxy-4-hydroxy-2-oxoadipate aldolase/oxaloacetate decarboxylase n=1 Tax=Azospirillum agricola TaxID=1720247 RepID=UPI001AE993B7|nr:4-carboxy-4-hydroxy-2-oxoadipate aldolase/oxaloacetate decarboxylase [Azospirillum agricola]MBP2228154.1 4-hydroxy-4-methyl-2-oxoglutarate aldolase [Azospirillum agricola]